MPLAHGHYHSIVKLDGNDVLVLKALRHGGTDELAFLQARHAVTTLIERGLIRDDTVTPQLTSEGAKLAAMLERQWPE